MTHLPSPSLSLPPSSPPLPLPSHYLPTLPALVLDDGVSCTDKALSRVTRRSLGQGALVVELKTVPPDVLQTPM